MQTASKFRDWASMARLPNVPTVWSNVFTAWVLSGANFNSQTQITHFILAVFGGTLLYIGGTTLTDVSDVAIDQIQRPERPLPARRVSLRVARIVSYGWMTGGTLAFIFAGGYGALFLLFCIISYNRLHQSGQSVAMMMMISCRLFLALVVGEVAFHVLGYDAWDMSMVKFPVFGFWAAALAAYICAITWLASKERVPWHRTVVGWMLAALPLLDALFLIVAGPEGSVVAPIGCFILILLLRRYASAT